MAKKQATKREFDWRSYTKPARLLSPEQEAELISGVLAPLLTWARSHDDVRFEIRARHAAIYLLGTLLLRIRGAEQPFLGEIDANIRLARTERSGAERLESWPLSTPSEVALCVSELDSLAALTARLAAHAQPAERTVLHAFASANGGLEDSDFVVVDTEYQYGHRRFDFVGMKRAEGVSGFPGFTTPRLVVGQLKSAGRPLTGASGLASYASDFAEFARALTGTHLQRAKVELDELVGQKQRLGLLPERIPFRHFTADDPEYLVVFAVPDVADPAFDAPIAELHDRLVARHYQPELLRLASIGPLGATESAESLELRAEGEMPYKAFKAYRKGLRG